MNSFYFITFFSYVGIMAYCKINDDFLEMVYWGFVGILLYLGWILTAIENKKK